MGFFAGGLQIQNLLHAAVPFCNPGLWEAEAGELQVQAQPGRFSNLDRLCLKVKKKNKLQNTQLRKPTALTEWLWAPLGRPQGSDTPLCSPGAAQTSFAVSSSSWPLWAMWLWASLVSSGQGGAGGPCCPPVALPQWCWSALSLDAWGPSEGDLPHGQPRRILRPEGHEECVSLESPGPPGLGVEQEPGSPGPPTSMVAQSLL